ncbi:hypothetical protein ACE6H2_011103 [Prunus campanulata]
MHTSGRRVSPALGLAWAHYINSRCSWQDMRNLLGLTVIMLLHQLYPVKYIGHFTLYLAHICPMHCLNL